MTGWRHILSWELDTGFEVGQRVRSLKEITAWEPPDPDEEDPEYIHGIDRVVPAGSEGTIVWLYSNSLEPFVDVFWDDLHFSVPVFIESLELV